MATQLGYKVLWNVSIKEPRNTGFPDRMIGYLISFSVKASILRRSGQKLSFLSRVFYYRNSILRFDLRDEWRDVTWRFCDKSVWQMLWMRPCAGFVLSGSVWPIYFPLSRVYDLHSSWHSVWGFHLCLCDDSLYSVICGSVQMLWMRHGSSRYSALCLVQLLANDPVSLVPLVIFPYVNRWYAFDGVV